MKLEDLIAQRPTLAKVIVAVAGTYAAHQPFKPMLEIETPEETIIGTVAVDGNEDARRAHFRKLGAQYALVDVLAVRIIGEAWFAPLLEDPATMLPMEERTDKRLVLLVSEMTATGMTTTVTIPIRNKSLHVEEASVTTGMAGAKELNHLAFAFFVGRKDRQVSMN